MVLFATVVIITIIILSIKVFKSKASVVEAVVIDEKVFEIKIQFAASKVLMEDIGTMLDEADGLYESIEAQLINRDHRRQMARGSFGMENCLHCRREHRNICSSGHGARKYKAKK